MRIFFKILLKLLDRIEELEQRSKYSLESLS